MTTAYIYNEETNECLLVVKGEKSAVETETCAQFEQHGTPAVYDPSQVTGVSEAEILHV